MNILFDSRSELHKRPFGCVHTGEPVWLSVHIPRRCAALRVGVVFSRSDGYEEEFPLLWSGLEHGYDLYRVTLTLPAFGLYRYHFRIATAEGEFRLLRRGSETGMNEGEPWQISMVPQNPVDERFQGACYYQIFPDRFCREGEPDLAGKLDYYWVHKHWDSTPEYRPWEGKILNCDFFGGNLAGICKKLDYLAGLGVTALYLNPIFMAYSNHRYDTSDYLRIDPMLGTEEDFRLLCEEAHKRGISVLLDGVFSHTGADSRYFDIYNRYGNGAYHDPNSPYRGWYDFQEYPSRYTSWWGIATLPCVNELSPDYMDFIIEGEDSVVAHWLRLGADGFRLDVADELPDAFIAALHRRVHELKPDALVLGEVWEDASNKISYSVERRYFTGAELDATMNYPFKEAIIQYMLGHSDAAALAETVMTIAENYPPQILNAVMNSLGTHDTPRILTVLGAPATPGTREGRANHRLTDSERELALQRERAAAFLQFALPGSPSIYYGDEVGVEGFEDPFNRRTFPWELEGQVLTSFYRSLIRLKKGHPALRFGTVRAREDHRIFRFVREHGGRRLTGFAASVHGAALAAPEGRLIFAESAVCEGGMLRLSPYGTALFEEKI